MCGSVCVYKLRPNATESDFKPQADWLNLGNGVLEGLEFKCLRSQDINHYYRPLGLLVYYLLRSTPNSKNIRIKAKKSYQRHKKLAQHRD